jgi:hypothetical protein
MRRSIDFSRWTFIEYVSLAAREPVYSAAVAWIFGEHSPLPLDQRLAVAAALFDVDVGDSTAITTKREWKNIDLLLTFERKVGQVHVVIENKIKATEGLQQLATYDQHLGNLPGIIVKVFLTLTGEPPRSGDGWKAVSYSKLHHALCAQPAADGPYVFDLCRALERLVTVANTARETPELLAPFAFDDPGASNATDVTSYVEAMRLHKVVQRIWMSELAERLGIPPPWRVLIGETHGQALMNVEAVPSSDQPAYSVGLQLQWRTLKAFCAPHPYPRVASEDQHRGVEDILKTVKSRFDPNGSKGPSRNGSRGFRSFTVANLPLGRNIDKWIKVVRPQLDELCEAFPAAMPIE